MRMKIILSILFCVTTSWSWAQDDLLSALEAETKTETKQFAESTFKGSRLINGHTVITRKKGSLEFLIAHRFGRINSGAYEFFGIDGANVRFGLERGLTDRLTIGVGRNSFEKTYDGFAKYAFFRQHTGVHIFPVSITWFSSAAIKTLKSTDPDLKPTIAQRTVYSHVLLVARKFSPGFSLQVMPALIHRNSVLPEDANDIFALGMGARVKISKRISINGEYYQRFDTPANDPFKNSFAIGVDIDTGGHVFQLHLTNSQSMIEKGFIAETRGNFFKGDIHFGFNITRVFN